MGGVVDNARRACTYRHAAGHRPPPPLDADVVTRLGLLDMSEAAWSNDRYYDVWRKLRADYEIDRRFDGLNRKVCGRPKDGSGNARQPKN